MLIKNLLRLNETKNYFIAEYSCKSCGIVSLLLKKDNSLYYDVINQRFCKDRDITLKKSLTEYGVKQEKISIRNAKKIAKLNYDDFYAEFKELYCKDNEILEDENYTFFSVL